MLGSIYWLLFFVALCHASAPDGIPVKEGERPYHVSLQHEVNNRWSHFCSGSIVDKDWVLTSATCCQGLTISPKGDISKKDTRAYNTNKMHYFFWKAVKIVAGALNLNQAETGMGKQHRDASKVIIHPEFDTTFLSDDMCMIKVNLDHFMSHMHDGFFFWKTHATGWQQFWSDW